MSHYAYYVADIPVSGTDAPFVRPIIEYLIGLDFCHDDDQPVPKPDFELPEHELFSHPLLHRLMHNGNGKVFEGDSEVSECRILDDDIGGGFLLEMRSSVNHHDRLLRAWHDWICVFIDLEHGAEFGEFWDEDYRWRQAPLFVGRPLLLRAEPIDMGFMGTEEPKNPYEPFYYEDRN